MGEVHHSRTRRRNRRCGGFGTKERFEQSLIRRRIQRRMLGAHVSDLQTSQGKISLSANEVSRRRSYRRR
jgi:hypothetical protein